MVTPHITKTVKFLRKNRTNSEKIFWEKVSNKKFHNTKFLRQHPIKFQYENRTRFFVADFYCSTKKLIVEIDGKIHENQKDQDLFREEVCQRLGYKTIRFTNQEIENNLPEVLEKLEKLIK